MINLGDVFISQEKASHIKRRDKGAYDGTGQEPKQGGPRSIKGRANKIGKLDRKTDCGSWVGGTKRREQLGKSKRTKSSYPARGD